MSAALKHESGSPEKEKVDSTAKFNIFNEESKFILSPQENHQRERRYADGKTYVQYTRIHCTACSCHLGSAIANFQDIFVHPLLKVLLCKNCFEFYQNGDFVQDDDGNEMYCRWCGQGGTLVCCSTCPKVFCKSCIRKNFKRNKFFQITANDNWKCFVCDSTQISALRIQCYEFRQYCTSQKNASSKEISRSVSNLLDYSTCCVSRYRSSKVQRTNGNSNESDHAEQERKRSPIRLFQPKKQKLISKDQKVGLHENETEVGSKNGTSQLIWKEGRYTKVHCNIDNKNTFVTKPYTFVNISSSKEQPVIHDDVRQLNSLVNQTPTTFIRRSNCQIRSEFIPSQHFLYRTDNQSCPVRVIRAHDFVENRIKEIDRVIRETALVNSTFASAILQLSQMNSNAETLSEHITIYNSLQECLSTSILSLEQIQDALTTSGMRVSRTSGFRH